MRKLCCLMLCLLVLVGCQYSTTNLANDLVSALKQADQIEPLDFSNANKDIYDYYQPRDVGRIQSNTLSSVFKKDNVQFIMNFNPNHVVILDYYNKDGALQKMEPSVERKSSTYISIVGTYNGNAKSLYDYNLKLELLDNGSYFIDFDMEYVNFYAVSHPAQIESLVKTMYQMGASFNFDAEHIVALYSMKSNADKITQDLEEYTEVLPAEGFLSDLKEDQE